MRYGNMRKLAIKKKRTKQNKKTLFSVGKHSLVCDKSHKHKDIATALDWRSWTSYTTQCNGVASHGPPIGVETNLNLMIPWSSCTAWHFMRVYLHAGTTVDIWHTHQTNHDYFDHRKKAGKKCWFLNLRYKSVDLVKCVIPLPSVMVVSY